MGLQISSSSPATHPSSQLASPPYYPYLNAMINSRTHTWIYTNAMIIKFSKHALHERTICYYFFHPPNKYTTNQTNNQKKKFTGRPSSQAHPAQAAAGSRQHPGRSRGRGRARSPPGSRRRRGGGPSRGRGRAGLWAWCGGCRRVAAGVGSWERREKKGMNGCCVVRGASPP